MKDSPYSGKKRIKKVVTILGFTLAGLLGILLVALLGLYVLTTQRLNKEYTIQAASIPIPIDEASIAEGKRQYFTRGCVDCHGEDGRGMDLLNDPLVGHITAANLTSGQGGIGVYYTDQDFVRTIRHGVRPDGKPVIVMPSQEFTDISDTDLGSLIAFIKSLPPVDSPQGYRSVGPLGRVLLISGQATILPVEEIDHQAQRPVRLTPEVTVEYGEYLAKTCVGCHGQGLSGGPIPGLPPEPPFPANLTSDIDTGLGSWEEADFVRAIREGKRPDGTDISTVMPWQNFKQMTDTELGALWLYLQSIPPQPEGNR